MNSKVDFEAIPWTLPVAGVRVKVFRQDGRQLRLAEYTREFVEADWCRKGHVGYVLEGSFELEFGGGRVTLQAGDGIFIRAGEASKHKARVLSEVARVVLVEEC